MSERKVRILMARLGEGYDAAVMRLARAFRDAGFEVIYTDLQDPEAIVRSSIQESVDHIGITTLPGADINSLSKIIDLLAREESSHIRVTAGGFLADEDVLRLKEMGVVEFFPVGTTYQELIQWSRDNIKASVV